MHGRKLLSVFVVFAVISAGTGACKKSEKLSQLKNESDFIKPVAVFRVEKRKMEEKLTVMGDVKGWRETDVFSKVPGKLLKYLVRQGEWVKKGQPIALIDQDLTGVRYRPAVIKAPVDGQVAVLYLDPGETVTPPTMSRTMGIPVARVVNSRKVRIIMRIPDRYMGRVKPGMKVEVNISEHGGWIRRGRIVKIQPVVDIKTRTFGAEALLNNTDNLLVPGMFVKVRIITKVKKDAVAVHKDALLRRNGKFVVMKVKNGVVEEVPVNVGINDEPYVEVRGNVAPGDYVIISGPALFHTGDKAKIVEVFKP